MRTLLSAASCSHRGPETRRGDGRPGAGGSEGAVEGTEQNVPQCAEISSRLYPHMAILMNGRGVVDDVGVVDRGSEGRDEGVREGRALGE